MKTASRTITLDAKDQTLGRLASRAAMILRGKDTPDFKPYAAPAVKLIINNAKQLRFTGTKLTTKFYHRFSGYPGGITTTTLAQEFTKNPAELIRRSIVRMLPKNRLSSQLIKNLTIHN